MDGASVGSPAQSLPSTWPNTCTSSREASLNVTGRFVWSIRLVDNRTQEHGRYSLKCIFAKSIQRGRTNEEGVFGTRTCEVGSRACEDSLHYRTLMQAAMTPRCGGAGPPTRNPGGSFHYVLTPPVHPTTDCSFNERCVRRTNSPSRPQIV